MSADCLRLSALSHARHCKVAEAVTAKVGAAKVGIRLSPYNTFLQDGLDEDGVELMMYLVKELAKLKLLYLHCIEPRWVAPASPPVMLAHGDLLMDIATTVAEPALHQAQMDCLGILTR